MPADSNSPLIRKLGIKPAMRVVFVNAPPTFAAALGPLPAGVELQPPEEDQPSDLDVIVFFANSQRQLRAQFPKLAATLTPNGALWIAWPKKASGIATDLSDDVVRVAGLEYGLVDNKVCSIDSTWSAQRFVVRLKDRPKRTGAKKR
jgi:hypothetical protein